MVMSQRIEIWVELTGYISLVSLFDSQNVIALIILSLYLFVSTKAQSTNKMKEKQTNK